MVAEMPAEVLMEETHTGAGGGSDIARAHVRALHKFLGLATIFSYKLPDHATHWAPSLV